jgi:hypothetical protein
MITGLVDIFRARATALYHKWGACLAPGKAESFFVGEAWAFSGWQAPSLDLNSELREFHVSGLARYRLK